MSTSHGNHPHHHDHSHDHDHDHDHGDHAHPHSPPAPDDDDHYDRYEVLLQTAIRQLLDEKGIITADELHRQIDYQDSLTPAIGGKIVAKAWVDPEFKKKLIADPLKTINASFELDITTPLDLVVLENTPTVHNVVVCTLCSCYPRMLLGIPPAWYKSIDYRSRIVVEPRKVLAEFGTHLPSDVEVRVSDSTADLRFLVLPNRPAGTEKLSEAQLAELVTRDSMIGTSLAQSPKP
ncbi:nitrile hydratase subunit alpha [Zwartia sp.]|uniref:nitrile hydratase subunit alpha n=1 Tax=Zwartia sp. TaxID=2978004 RepID=UPI002719E77A|nr:nitrile hydratase subunit alpha [Zwartia sp.]MDO9026098.1 nitrile hydratase subunit alpha [Zwartia sp.]